MAPTLSNNLSNQSQSAIGLAGIQSDGLQAQTGSRRLLKLPSVLDRVPVSKTDWYRRIRNGTAPAPLSLGSKSVAWLESDIDAFINALSKVKK